jgi:large repetitive protein
MKNHLAGLVSASAGVIFGAMLFLGASVPAAGAENPSRIAVIDDSSRVRLAHTTHPAVQSAADLGRLDPNMRMERMVLVIGPSDEMRRPLHTFLDSLHDRKSPAYHHWLTPEQFGEKFGPSQADLDKIQSWLQERGFDGIKVARGRSHIEFSGSAQLVEQAFSTQMHQYQTGEETHVANAADISIPQAMSGIVRGVQLNNFLLKPAMTPPISVRRDASGHLSPVAPSFTPSFDQHFLAPGDFAKIYDINPLYQQGIDGTGTTIAIVARSNISMSDVEIFRQAFNLPPNDPEIVLNGFDPGALAGGDTIEASLDTEWAGAVAPGATVKVVVSGTGTTDGVVLSSAYIVDNNLADIMTMSFEACEQSLGSFNDLFNALWQQAAAQGISVFVASGDQGAAGCDPNALLNNPAQGGLAVNGLASTPFNTAVGGTQFNENGNDSTFWIIDPQMNLLGQVSNLGYIPEAVWNQSCDPNGTCFDPNLKGTGLFSLAAGGGGVSTIYSKPSWQSAGVPGMPMDNQRDVPDVSLTASGHDAYLMCWGAFGVLPCTISGSGEQTVLLSAGAVGGTSASSPAFAGIMALIDQKQGGRQGLANFVLYKLATGENFSTCNSSNRTNPNTPAPSACVFNDITLGSNGVPGNDTLAGTVPPGDVDGQVGYNALPGYDSASGLGSVDVTNLVNAWSSVVFLGSTTTLSATTATTIQHGQSITFNAAVQPLSGNGTPTGNVGLIAQVASPLPSGVGVGGGVLANGAFSGGINGLPGGQYNVIAHYTGDTVFGGSNSNPVAVNVTPENSIISVIGFDQNGIPQPSPLSFGYGDPFTIGFNIGSVSGTGNPSGTVTVFDNGVQVAQVPVDSAGFAKVINCIVQSTICFSPLSTHSVTATYSGDNSLNPSTSQPFVYNIVKGTPVGVAAFDQVGGVLIDVAFFQSSLQVPPTGTFTITDSFNGQTSNLASAPVKGTFQFFGPFTLPAGTHSITVSYSGDNNYLGVDFPPASIVISPPPPALLPVTATITPLTSSMTVGQPASFTITVKSGSPQSSATPTGFVQFFDGVAIGAGVDASLVNGTVTIQTIMPSTGPFVVALYEGDTVFAPSATPPVNVTVAPATPALMMSANSAVVQTGEQVTVTAALAGVHGAVQPFGTVQFFDAFNGGAPAPFGPPQFAAGNQSVPGNPVPINLRQALPLGTHVFTANYSGDTDYNALATSNNSVTVNVVAMSSQTSLKLLNAPAAVGQPANFNVIVSSPQSPALPTGQVVLTTGAGSLGQPVTLVNGTASLQVAAPAVDSAIVARYLGDLSFAPSFSAPVSLNVGKGTPTVSVTADSTGVPPGGNFNATIHVIPPPGALNGSGTVQLFQSFNGGTPSSSTQGPLPYFGDGTVTFHQLVGGVGTYTFTASYSGDSNYNGVAAANSVPVTVNVSSSFGFALIAPNGATQTISAGQTATFNLQLQANGSTGTVNFTCTGAPSDMSCAVNPNPVQLTGGNTVAMTVTVAPISHGQLSPSGFYRFPVVVAAMFGLALLGLMAKTRMQAMMLMFLAVALLVGVNGCGGGSTTPVQNPNTSTIVVTGNNGATSSSVSLTLVVNR